MFKAMYLMCLPVFLFLLSSLSSVLPNLRLGKVTVTSFRLLDSSYPQIHVGTCMRNTSQVINQVSIEDPEVQNVCILVIEILFPNTIFYFLFIPVPPAAVFQFQQWLVRAPPIYHSTSVFPWTPHRDWCLNLTVYMQPGLLCKDQASSLNLTLVGFTSGIHLTLDNH